MKIILSLSILLITFTSFYGCSLIGAEDSCENIEGVYFLQKIGDESLPYTAYYIDSDNNSKITKGTQMIYTSSWDTMLYNTVTLDGKTSEKKFRSTGKYTCDDGVISILNEENEAGGKGYIDGKTISIGADSGYDYVWVKQ